MFKTKLLIIIKVLELINWDLGHTADLHHYAQEREREVKLRLLTDVSYSQRHILVPAVPAAYTSPALDEQIFSITAIAYYCG